MKPLETNLMTMLRLPSKTEEMEMFTTYDMVAVFDRYLPLADYILDEYASPNDEMSIMAEETAYTALLAMIAQFRRTRGYETDIPFSQLVTRTVYTFMDEFEKEGKLYKVSKSLVMK